MGFAAAFLSMEIHLGVAARVRRFCRRGWLASLWLTGVFDLPGRPPTTRRG